MRFISVGVGGPQGHSLPHYLDIKRPHYVSLPPHGNEICTLEDSNVNDSNIVSDMDGKVKVKRLNCQRHEKRQGPVSRVWLKPLGSRSEPNSAVY